MKKSNALTALFGLSLMIVAAGCVTTEQEREPRINPVPRPEAESEAEEAEGLSELPVMLEQDVELVVFGLSCPLCASNLDNQLRRIPGVAGQQVDLESGIIQVQVRSGGFVQTESLRRAVADAGFTLQDIRMKEAQ